MGANNHVTTQPENWEPPMTTKREQLIGDLQEQDEITNVESSDSAQNTIQFTCRSTMPGDIPSNVLQVLAEHEVNLFGTPSTDRNTHFAGIEL